MLVKKKILFDKLIVLLSYPFQDVVQIVRDRMKVMIRINNLLAKRSLVNQIKR